MGTEKKGKKERRYNAVIGKEMSKSEIKGRSKKGMEQPGG